MRCIAAASVGIALLLAGNAGAQPSSKSADALFREGRAAFDVSDFPTACAKFSASYEADPAPGTLLNLAVCEDRIGRLSSARKHLIDVLPRLKPTDDRIPFARDLVAKLDGRIPLATLTLAPGAPAETTVREAGEAPLAIGVPLQLDPGVHVLLVTAPGWPGGQVRLLLVEGQRASVVVAPGDRPAASGGSAAAEDPDAGRRLRRTLAYVAGGIGVAGFGLATVTGILLLSKKSDLDAPGNCPDQRCTPQGLATLQDDRSTALLPLNTTGWIVGGVGLAAGATLFLTSRGGPAAKGSAQIAPFLGPTGAGVAGSF